MISMGSAGAILQSMIKITNISLFINIGRWDHIQIVNTSPDLVATPMDQVTTIAYIYIYIHMHTRPMRWHRRGAINVKYPLLFEDLQKFTFATSYATLLQAEARD